jgi:hypothetical protein
MKVKEKKAVIEGLGRRGFLQKTGLAAVGFTGLGGPALASSATVSEPTTRGLP